MTRQELTSHIFSKKSYLCVGLDTDPKKIPVHLRSRPDGVLQFNKAIIDATKDHCVAYKINTAFYEAQGAKGWEVMQETEAYIPATHFKIADAKRGDIGNTSTQYARAFFEQMNFDAITVAPYMGADSILPFLEYKDKWTILLGLTSNTGAHDFEMQTIVETEEILEEGRHYIREQKMYLYEKVLTTAAKWGSLDNLMFVVGATQANQVENIRKLCPYHFFLVPGVGFQGGSLKNISEAGFIADCGLLINASRAIIYATDGENFAEEAALVSKQLAVEMNGYFG